MGVDDRLAISITSADGRTKRWGPDEPEPIDIPGDLTFSSSIPGGWKDLSCSLLRRIDLDYSDQALFDDIRVYGPGNRTAFEGRLAQFPRSHGQGFSITPGAVGLSAELEDFPAFVEVYVDRDMAWSEFPFDRRIQVAASSISMGDFSWSREIGALTVTLPNQALGAQTITEAWKAYPAGVAIAQIMYNGANTTRPSGWLNRLTSQSTLGTGGTSSTLTLDGTLRTQAIASPVRYVGVDLYSNGNAATPAAGSICRFTQLAAYGNHGLTTRAISGEPDGLYASDVIADILARAAPDLAIDEIEATTFAIAHLVFADPVTAADAISTINAYHLYDWGVYDKGFFYRAPDPSRLTWQARLSAGAHLDLEGDSAAQVWNGVVVSYTDALGQRRLVGPPAANWPGGTALADATDASLVDATATNPLNAWGKRRWAKLDIGLVTNDAGAVSLGAVWLAERSLAQRRGTLTLTGTVKHPTEGEVPVWRVRAGDFVSIADHPASVPRRIIETRYTHATRSVTCTLDNTNFKLESILERLAVQVVGVL